MNFSSQSFDLNLMSLETLYQKDFPKVDWLVEGLIPQHSRIVFSGQPESYKSFIAQAIAVAVSQGMPVFDRYKTLQSRVLIVDLENHEETIRDRMILLDAPNTKNLLFSTNEAFSLEKPACIKAVTALIEKYNVRLVILDSFIRMHQSDEDNSVAMAQVTKSIKQISDAGATVIFIHHDKKGDADSQDAQSLRGSSEIRASVDLQYGFKAKENTITIQQLKNRLQQKSAPLALTIVNQGGHIHFEYQGQLKSEAAQTNEEVETVIKSILTDQQNLNYTALLKEVISCGYAKHRVTKVLTLLREAGIITAVSTGNKNEKAYVWVNNPNHPIPKEAGLLGLLPTSEERVKEVMEALNPEMDSPSPQ